MICSNCGTQNNNGSKFCIKCGNHLSDVQSQVQTTQSYEQNENVMNSEPQQIQYENYQQQNVNNNFSSNINTNSKIKMSITEYLFVILAVILKPFTAFKEELNKFNRFENSAILSLIVSIMATFIVLVKTMFNTVRVTSYRSKEVEWAWENLKEINYVQVIGKTFLIYLGIMVAIACVYYMASLVVKKETNFSRLLGISAASVVPILFCSLVLSPLLSMIYTPLGMGITIIGGVYTIIIMYETINNEILLEGNAKFYFNLVCLSILTIVAYYLYMKLFMGSVSSSVDNILDMFGY